MGKCGKNDVKVGVCKMKTKTYFVIFSDACSILELMFCRLHYTTLSAAFIQLCLQSELNKVSISNYVKFQFQRISSEVERAFEKMTKLSIKIGPKRTITRQL